jgi:excisionase family DNA binding protein
MLRFDPETFDVLAEAVAERLGDRVSHDDRSSPWMTAAQAAEYLHVPLKTIYNWTSAGCIPHRKIGNRLMFHRERLDAWLDRYREGRLR